MRSLPYEDNCFDLVVSNSTLHHFPTHADVVTAVEAFYRVLKPGGQLLVTFYNLANPILSLPFAFLNRLGLVPDFVGESVTPAGLQRIRSCMCHALRVLTRSAAPSFASARYGNRASKLSCGSGIDDSAAPVHSFVKTTRAEQ